MQFVSVAGAIIAVIVMCILAYKKINPFVISLIGSLILIFTNGLNLMETIFDTYMGSVGSFCASWILVFIVGSIYGKCLEVSGIAKRVASTLLEKIGEKNVILAATVTCTIMCMAGISNYVLIFTVYPLISQIFKRANISRNLMPAVIYFGCSSFLTVIPGVVTVQGIMLCDTLGTNLAAAPLMCLLTGILMFALFYLYIMHENKKAIARGESYELAEGEEAYDPENENWEDIPNIFMSLLPLVMLVGGVFLLKKYFANSTQCVVTVMLVTMLFVIVTNFKKIKEYALNRIVEEGFGQCLNGVFAAAGFLAFATVMQMGPCYDYLVKGIEFVTNHVNGYFGAALATSVSAGITVSSLGGITLFTGTLAGPFLNIGLNMSALHRIVQIATMTLDSLPWCSNIIIYLMVCKCTHKGAYKHIGVTCCLIPAIVTIFACILAMIGIA